MSPPGPLQMYALSPVTSQDLKADSKCEDASVPQVKYDFKAIDALTDVNKDEMCGELGSCCFTSARQ